MDGAVEVGMGGGVHAGLELLGGWGGGWWSTENGLEAGGTGVGDVGMVSLGLLVVIGWGVVMWGSVGIGTCGRCQLAGFGFRTF